MKRFATVLIALVCVAAGAAYWLDLVNFTDLETGFTTLGPYWLRYAVLGLVLLLAALASLMAVDRARSLNRPAALQGLLAIVTGLSFAGLCGIALDFNLSELTASLTGGMSLVSTLLYSLTAIWFLMLGISRISVRNEAPSRSAVLGIAGTLSLYLLTVYRFCMVPTGIIRVGNTVSALAALAALLFCTAQTKSAYVAEKRGGSWLYFTGMASFLMDTCLALPASVCQLLAGNVSPVILAQDVALALIGLNGLTYALAAVGESLPESSREDRRETAEEAPEQELVETTIPSEEE